MRTLVVAVVLAAWTAIGGTAQNRYERAPFWTIPAVDAADAERFPESDQLPRNRDIAVAISGGGVRSASSAIGELRGLEKAELLGRVQYVSVVSGGAWAAIPWTFSGEPDLLGTYQDPRALRLDDVNTHVNGKLSDGASRVSIELASTIEAVLEAWAFNIPPDASHDVLGLVRQLLGAAPSTAQTYATLLGTTLLKPFGDVLGQDFQWNEKQGTDFAQLNPGPRVRGVVQPQPGRPFLIVNADLVNAGADFAYPYAIPFEITPMYVGARSTRGIFGGVYTWPTAYNAATARTIAKTKDGVSGTLEYSHDATHPRLALEDVAASTGAAPLFFVVGGSQLRADITTFLRVQGGAYFPQFTHLAARKGDILPPSVKWAHADGGARDNLGLAALLARRARKIIVFVNVDKPDANNNDDIASLFVPGAAANTSDKSGNVMLEGGKDVLALTRQKFADAVRDRKPLVACGDYDVKRNDLFNIRAYKGVQICWVYPYRVETWVDALDPPLRAVVTADRPGQYGNFTNFPWFSTFAENRDIRHPTTLGLLKLSNVQVNLLSNLMAWSVNESKQRFVDAFGASP